MTLRATGSQPQEWPRRCTLALVIALTLTPALTLARPLRATPFDAGQMRIGAGLGSAHPYISFGLSFGYYVADGVELGLGGQLFFGAEPKIYQLTPYGTYVFYQIPDFSPYLGAFYREVIVEGEPSLGWQSVGGRAGLIYWGSGRLLIGGGIVVERLLDCVGDDCQRNYPELQLQISF
ncbi:MAG: hypothetical protein VYD19_08080 [Myxococcota bacterium]|nr:hypothetical protein [Myxococcota bacterium]